MLVRGQGWTEQNQGKLYFLDEKLKNDKLLLVVKVYPDEAPFESCHIIREEDESYLITKSFLPENTDVDMYSYDESFNLQQRDRTSLRWVYGRCYHF